jgi:NAD(P)-dependent dehydrogenase (short-subunit alcohol dehydrogenase family)
MAAASRIFITGASSGIGLALARHYLAQGATVGVAARRAELLWNLADQFPGKVHVYPLDVRDAAALQNAARDFMTRAGVPDVVVANAGVSIGTLTRYAEDNDVFQHVMDINLLGAVKTFQPFTEAMRQAGRGRMVGIASIAGFRGLSGLGAYSASKAALISYLESLRVDLHGSGVKVVTICPGYIKTPMTEVNHYPMPFILPVEEAVRRIARVIERGSKFAVIPWQMALIGRLMKVLPNWLYDVLFSKAPHKPRKLA